jgi:diadenylate cyclase
VIKLRVNRDTITTDILKLLAPGTPIREGLDNILKAKTGALIVIGDSKEVLDLVDGRVLNK